MQGREQNWRIEPNPCINLSVSQHHRAIKSSRQSGTAFVLFQSLLISLTLLITNGFLLCDAVSFYEVSFKNACSRTDNWLFIQIATRLIWR